MELHDLSASHRGAGILRLRMLFLVDFDGTVAPTDTVDALLERFADPEWRRLEERWVRGEISSRQCMAA